MKALCWHSVGLRETRSRGRFEAVQMVESESDSAKRVSGVGEIA